MSDESGSQTNSDSEMEVAEESVSLEPKPKKIIPVNNTEGLKSKLDSIKLDLNWIEKLDVTVEGIANGVKKSGGNDAEEEKAEHDFKRELAFINQAKAAAAKAMSRLNKLGTPLKRPNDYFAEMAKSDEHMTKIRQKLLSKESGIERSEKAKALRDQKKNAKKVQHQVLLKKQSEKRAMMEALKKSKKGKFDVSQILEEKKNQQRSQQKEKVEKWKEEHKKRDNKTGGGVKNNRRKYSKEQYKNERYGYGGKKRGSKQNDAESSSQLPGMGNRKPFHGKTQGKQGMHSKRPRAKSTRRRR